MDPDELDELVLEGHGGAIEDAADADEPDADRRGALEKRLKCEVIAVAEEVARERGESAMRASRRSSCSASSSSPGRTRRRSLRTCTRSRIIATVRR